LDTVVAREPKMSKKDKAICIIIVAVAVVAALLLVNYEWDRDPSFAGSKAYQPNYIGLHIK